MKERAPLRAYSMVLLSIFGGVEVVSVRGTSIYLSRKNTAKFNIAILNSDGTPYTPSVDDRVVFSLKKAVYVSDYIIQKELDLVSGGFVLELSADELNLDFGDYIYDLKIYMGNGLEQTIITPSLFCVEEVVNNE